MNFPSFKDFTDRLGPDYVEQVHKRAMGEYDAQSPKSVEDLAALMFHYSFSTALDLLGSYHEWLAQSLQQKK